MEPDLNRRQALLLAGGLVAGVYAGGVLGDALGPPAVGATNPAPRFEFGGRIRQTLDGIRLPCSTVMQSFAVDSRHRWLYVAQLVHGGLRLPGESGPRSQEARALAGDLCITRLSLAGRQLGHMYLTGAGHGVSLGVEPVSRGTVLWTEADAAPEGRNGWGRRLARFTFQPGRVFTSRSAEVRTISLASGTRRVTASVDQFGHTLLQRYHRDGETWFGLFDLTAASSGRARPLATVRQPPVVADGRPLQGFTHLGGYLYLLEGSGYGTHDSRPPSGNTHLSCVDLVTGRLVDRTLVRVAPELSHREPEGLAVHLSDPTDVNSARLCFGLASGRPGARRMNLFVTSAKDG